MNDEDHKVHLTAYNARNSYENKRIAITILSVIIIAALVVILCKFLLAS